MVALTTDLISKQPWLFIRFPRPVNAWTSNLPFNTCDKLKALDTKQKMDDESIRKKNGRNLFCEYLLFVKPMSDFESCFCIKNVETHGFAIFQVGQYFV